MLTSWRSMRSHHFDIQNKTHPLIQVQMMTVNTNEKNKRDGDYISEMFTASCGGGIVFLTEYWILWFTSKTFLPNYNNVIRFQCDMYNGDVSSIYSDLPTFMPVVFQHVWKSCMKILWMKLDYTYSHPRKFNPSKQGCLDKYTCYRTLHMYSFIRLLQAPFCSTYFYLQINIKKNSCCIFL